MKQRLADLKATRAKYQWPPKELDDRIDRVRAGALHTPAQNE